MEFPAGSSKTLKRDIKNLKSVWSRESVITTRGVVYLCELMEKLIQVTEKQRRRTRHKLTDWQRACSVGMKEGRGVKQIAEEYRAAKRR